MASGHAQTPLSRLWQLPLLVFSLAVFAYAAWLLVRPAPAPTVGQRLAAAQDMIRKGRSDAAAAQINVIFQEAMTPQQEGAARMLLAQAMDLTRVRDRQDSPEVHRRIIQQTEQAISLGIESDAAAHQRMAECYDALGKPAAAIEHYQKAAGLDADRAVQWRRRVIDLQLRQEDAAAAEVSLDAYLKMKSLSGAESAWAMGQKAKILVDRGAFVEACSLLSEAMRIEPRDPVASATCNYWLGYCAWKLGQHQEAERYLRLARDQFKGQHQFDAEAAYLLGRIHQDRKDYPTANSFYNAVIQSYYDARLALAATIGRGVCRIAVGETEAGMTDLQDAFRKVRDKQTLPTSLREQAVASLQLGAQLLTVAGDCGSALELMACEQELVPKPAPGFFSRLAKLYERRAEQVQTQVADAKAGDRPGLQYKSRDFRTKAGDAHIAYSRALVLTDDKGYGSALWKGIELYDQAADLPRAIAALETFVGERPDDPLTPDAYLRLGQAYHAEGLFDKAIAAYRQCQFRYGSTLAAAKSLVPLARAYIAKGPDAYARAEDTLRSVVENNPQITPEAAEFREALLELAQLHYSTARYEMAISKLEELTARYPEDERKGQLLFLMADSYRKSAMLLDDQIKRADSLSTTRPAIDVVLAKEARTQRLTQARALYDRAVEHYRATQAPVRELDRLYLKLSHFYRADCVHDLGNYLDAIKLYDDAAFRYQDDPSALAAYVQIVNANVALGRLDEARAANERAKWMLRRMPQDVFDASALAMRKKEWEQWLKWSGEAGLWK